MHWCTAVIPALRRRQRQENQQAAARPATMQDCVRNFSLIKAEAQLKSTPIAMGFRYKWPPGHTIA